jgi:hypothetical protein
MRPNYYISSLVLPLIILIIAYYCCCYYYYYYYYYVTLRANNNMMTRPSYVVPAYRPAGSYCSVVSLFSSLLFKVFSDEAQQQHMSGSEIELLYCIELAYYAGGLLASNSNEVVYYLTCYS